MEDLKKDSKFSKALSLFIVFFKIGLFTFGGGYAMIPFIEEEVSNSKKWLDKEEILDVFAIAEATPGVVAVNTATFVGYKIAGVLGSIFATIGVVLPSFVIIFLISIFYEAFKKIEIINMAFTGIKVGVMVLILNAAFRLGGKLEKNIFNIALIVIAVILSLFTKINVIFIIIGYIIFGIIYGIIKEKAVKK